MKEFADMGCERKKASRKTAWILNPHRAEESKQS
jgi:hypothetical protein